MRCLECLAARSGRWRAAPKTAIVELCLALAGADIAYVPLDPGNGWPPDFTQAPAENVAAVYLNFPSNPAAGAAPEGAFEDAVTYAQTTGAAIVHDFTYGDLVFDRRAPQSFLATPGAKDTGVEMFSMSKSRSSSGSTCSTAIAASGSSGRFRGLHRSVNRGRDAARQQRY